MKTSIRLFIAGLFIFSNLNAQQILSFNVLPANPTTNDQITILANLQFNNTGCQLSNKNHAMNGGKILANAHHCEGFLTAICNITDTFNIGQLPAGNYTFDLTLTSGSGSAPCTPGIVPNDRDSISFSVSTLVGLKENLPQTPLFYPNPVKHTLNLTKSVKLSELKIYDSIGDLVFSSINPPQNINLSELPSGIYFLELNNKKNIQRIKFIKE